LRAIFFISEISPDLVVIQHGLNDVWPRMVGVLESDFGNYRKPWGAPSPKMKKEYLFFNKPMLVALAMMVKNYSEFLSFLFDRVYRYRAVNDAFIEEHDNLSIGNMVSRTDVESKRENLQKNGMTYFDRNTRYMVSLFKEMGAEVLLVTEPYTDKAGQSRREAMPAHNALLKKIAQEKGAFFYDLYKDMKKDDDHFPDGRHVSQRGSDLKRDLFFKYLIDTNLISYLIKKRARI